MNDLIFPFGDSSVIEKVSVTLKNTSVVCLRLFAQNLETHKIYDGDYLTFDFNEKITVCSFAMIRRTGGYQCFFVEFIEPEKIYLSNDIRKFWVKRSEILGRVIKLERDL